MADWPQTPKEDTPRHRQSDEIELEPWYRDGNDDIVEPDQVTLQTQYFWKNWVRILGVGPAALLIRLRMYCYFNRRTTERRDFCHPGQDTLAYELGVGDRKTIRRWLQRLEVFDFIRKKHRARWSDRHGQYIRTTNRYVVKMWDPVVPEHEGAAFVQDAQRTLTDSARPFENEGVPDKGQNASQHQRSAVDNPVERKNAPQQAEAKSPSRRSTLKKYNERNVALHVHEPIETEPATKAESTTLTPLRRMLQARFKPRAAPTRRHLRDVFPQISTSPEKRDELLRIEALAGDMLDQLGDSRSRPFYRLVARRFLEADLERLVHQALSDIREGDRLGTLRNQGAVFTARIKELAKAHGIDLRAAS